MGKKRVKSKKKATVKAANRAPLGKYVLAIVGVVGIAFVYLLLTDISSSVQEAKRFKEKGYGHLKKKKFRAAHRSYDKALEIAKKNDFMNRMPLFMADLLFHKAEAYGFDALTYPEKKGYHDKTLKSVDLFWQAHRINNDFKALKNIAELHAAAGNHEEQAKVGQQVFDVLLAHPQKVKVFGPADKTKFDDEEYTGLVQGALCPMLSQFMINQRNVLGNADLAAFYFWKMKQLFPQYITWKDTYQLPITYMADGVLNDKPWWNLTGGWRGEIEKHYEDILAELKRYLKKNGQFKLYSDHELVDKRDGEEQVKWDDWTEVPLWDDEFTENCHAFPKTCSLVHKIPQITGTDPQGQTVIGQVTIFRLRPGSHLRPHTGTNNVRLTNHLGLIIHSHWLPLAPIHSHWLSLAPIHSHWLSSALIHSHWLALPLIHSHWLSLPGSLIT